MNVIETSGTTPAVRDDLAAYALDDDLIVYDPATGESFVLNSTGRIVWSLLDGAHSEQAIAGELSSIFEVSYEQALTDVQGLLSEFRDANLVV